MKYRWLAIKSNGLAVSRSKLRLEEILNMPDTINVTFAQLSKADIIFTTSNSLESVGIRKAINSIISHTILVIEQNKVIEAITPQVREATWDEALEHAEATVAIVMRRRGLANGTDQGKVVAAARKFNNLPYDVYGAAGSGMSGNTRNAVAAGVGCSILFPAGAVLCASAAQRIAENAKDENADKKFFCSELVSRAFTEAGFPIIDGKATYANPNMVYHSTWLQYVGHLPTKDLNKGTNLTEEQKERNRKSGYRKG